MQATHKWPQKLSVSFSVTQAEDQTPCSSPVLVMASIHYPAVAGNTDTHTHTTSQSSWGMLTTQWRTPKEKKSFSPFLYTPIAPLTIAASCNPPCSWHSHSCFTQTQTLFSQPRFPIILSTHNFLCVLNTKERISHTNNEFLHLDSCRNVYPYSLKKIAWLFSLKY